MASNGWQGSAQFVDQNQRSRSPIGPTTGGAYQQDMYGSFPTDQIIGQQAVTDKAQSNQRDAQRILGQYGDQISGEDQSFLSSLAQNTGFASVLGGVGKLLEFISRPVSAANLAMEQGAPSGLSQLMYMGPLGLATWKSGNEWSDFLKTGEQRAVEQDLSTGITAGDYWKVLSGQREELVESIGTTLAGEDGMVFGSNVLESQGLTSELLDNLPDGVRQLARIHRFGGATSIDIVNDPLTYMSFGTGGMGRTVAQKTAATAIDDAARLGRQVVIESGGSIDDVARKTLSDLELWFVDDAVEKLKVGKWADDIPFDQRVNDVMDFRTVASFPDESQLSKLGQIAITNEEDMFFGTRSLVNDTVDDVVHQIEIRNYGRGLDANTSWGKYKAHARAGNAPLWTTGGLRIGPPALTPNQTGAQFTLPGTAGLFRSTARGVGKPLKWAMTREGVSDSSWLRRMSDLWEKQVLPSLASDKPLRKAAKEGKGYYGMRAMDEYAPKALINSLGERTLNEEMFNAVGWWGRAKRAISQGSKGISNAKRNELLTSVLEGVAAGTKITPPPGATAAQVEMLDEFVLEFSNIFERMGRVAATVDPTGIGMVAGEGKNFRPYVEMPKFTKMMQNIASVYGDAIGGNHNLRTVAGRDQYAADLTEAAKRAGRDDEITRADVDNWLQQLSANENAPRQVHAVGQTQQMRYRRAGRSTVLAPVYDDAGELVADAELGTFVSLPDLNESLVKTTRSVLDLHDLPAQFKTHSEITAKGATKIEQALELDPGKQVATWLVDMSGVIAERAKLAEGVIGGFVRHGVNTMNETLLRATIIESKLMDNISDTVMGTDAAIAARIELAAMGPDTVPYTVGGVVMHPTAKMAQDPAWVHMADSIDTISSELDATMTEFPRQYEAAVSDLIAAGEDETSARAIAFNSLAYRHGEAQEVFVSAVGDILRRYRDEAVHANVAAGDSYTEALARAVRMTERKSKMMQEELNNLAAGFAKKYDEGLSDTKMGSFSLFDSDEGGRLSARAASQRIQQMVDGARDTAAGARATEAASTGPEAVAARHTAEVRELLTEWSERGTGGVFDYSIDHLEFSSGLGGTLPQAQVVQGADTVLALFHPSWVQTNSAIGETAKLIQQMVGAKGSVTWKWWEANMVALDSAATLWIPRNPTQKKLVVIMEAMGDTGTLGGEVAKEMASAVGYQSAALRRHVGNSGTVGVIGPDITQVEAHKAVVPASSSLRKQYGVDGMTLGEFARSNGSTAALVEEANPGVIQMFSERHAGRKTMLQQAIDDPYRAKQKRPILTDYATDEEFKAAVTAWRDGQLPPPPPNEMSKFSMRAYTPYWEMDPAVLRELDEQMIAMDTAIATEMSSIDDLESMFIELDRFAARNGLTEEEARTLFNDWTEMRWDTVSPQLQNMYQEAHRYGRNPHAWEGELKRMHERWKDVLPGDYAGVIRKNMDDVQSQYGIFDDAGNLMGETTKSRGSGRNTAGSELGSTDFKWIKAGTELNVPPSRYSPGRQVRAVQSAKRQRMVTQQTPVAGVETRVGYESAGSAVPAMGREDAYLPESQTLEVLENQGVAPMEAAPDLTKPMADDFDTAEELNAALAEWRQKSGETRAPVASVDADAYQEYPGLVANLLNAPTTVMDRAGHLASQQQAEWFEEVLVSFEPLLAEPAFITSLNHQAVTVDDILAVIDRFRATQSFTQVYESGAFRKFLAAGLDYYDDSPEGFMEAAYAVTNYHTKSSRELTKLLRDADIPGRSKATTKQAKIDMLNDYYGDPFGKPVPQQRAIKMEPTTTTFGKAGGVNVGRPDFGGVTGRRSGQTFGNTHRAGDYTPNSTVRAVNDYAADLDAMVEANWKFHEDVADLAGQELRCPTNLSHSPCHAEVLARKADELVKTPYEVSRRGDERFSALVATLDDGRTIETHYQVDYKGYPDWQTGKAARTGPIEGGLGAGDTKAQSVEAYTNLWRTWADQNPELLRELHELTVQRGRTLNDLYSGSSLVNQADALTTIMKERFPKDLPVRQMEGVKAPVVALEPELQPTLVDDLEELGEEIPPHDDMFEITPDKIEALEPHEVFVFGSNEAGRHGKGAAKQAVDDFGAEQGVGFGRQGQSYAIPTKDSELKTLPIDTIEAYARRFMEDAGKQPGHKFYVTSIGTGLAGIPADDMAAMFRTIEVPDNVVLPEGWRGARSDFKLMDDRLPIELQPDLAGNYPPKFEAAIDAQFTTANKLHKERMAEYQAMKQSWDENSEEILATWQTQADAAEAGGYRIAPQPTAPVKPVMQDLDRTEVAHTLVEQLQTNPRMYAEFLDRVGRTPRKLRSTGAMAVEPSGRQAKVTMAEAMEGAEAQVARMVEENKQIVAAGGEPLPIPEVRELAAKNAERANAMSLEADLKQQRQYLMGEGELDPGLVYEGDAPIWEQEALQRSQQLIPEVEAGQFTVPPYPVGSPAGEINAVTLGVSGLADGADTWFAEILSDMGVPLIHHVNPENYTKFKARWPGVVDEGIPPLPASATAQQRKAAFIRGLATRTMQNVDEADMTIAFMPHIKEGQRSVGTIKTIEYAMIGKGQGYDMGWDKTWGANFGNMPELMPEFMEVYPGAHIYVPRKARVEKIIVVNGTPSDEGLRILREMMKGRVNVAGPRPQLVVNPGEYKAMVEKTVKAAAPGRAGILTDATGTPPLPPQPVPLQGVPVDRMNARIDQVDGIMSEMVQSPIAKMEEMSGFVSRVTALQDGDRINHMKGLLEAANEPGNMKGVTEFERWYADNADEVDAMIRATYGDDHSLIVKRVDGRYVPTVEHPYAEKTARAETSKGFNELVDDILTGTLTREEALAKGLDTVVVGAEIKKSIAQSAAQTRELLEASPDIAVTPTYAKEQVIKDFDVLSKLIDTAIQTGNSSTLRKFVGTEMRDGSFKTSVSWGRISDALQGEPQRLEQLQRWIEAAWVADTPWETEKAFLTWWMQERTLLSRLTYTVDQLRTQMRRRISDAYVENIWFGTHQNAEQAVALTERMMAELAGIPGAPAASGVPVDPKFRANAEMGELFSDRTKNRVPARNAEAMGIQLNYSDRMRNLSEQLRSWSRAPEFKAADGKEFLPRGDMATASDWYNHLADQIDDALASQAVRERITAPGMVTAESQGLGAGVLAGFDIHPDFAHMFRETTANLGSLFTPYGFDQVKGATNYLTQMWKRWATVVRPAFHIRNVIGGVTNGMFGGVMPWDYVRWAPEVMKFRKGMKELTRGSFDIDVLKTKGAFDGVALKYVDPEYHQVFRDAWNEGIIQTGFARTEGLRIADYSKGTPNPFDPDFYLAALGGQTMESLEDVLRLTMYGKYHQSGQKQFGTSMVNMLHFDYTDLTPIEETIKKFVPFYVWTRRNVPLQLRIASQAPGFMLAIDRTRGNWNEQQKLDNPDLYQPYMDSSGWLLPFGRQDEEGWAQMMWKPDIPMMDLDNLPLFAEGEGAWPVGRSAFDLGAWMQYGTDMLGPAFSIPYSTLTMQEGGSVNAPRGIAEVMQVLDAATNAVGAEGLVQTGHAPDGTPTDVQIPKLLDTLWHGIVPPGEDYLAMLGLAPRNPYRAADEGWLNSDDPAFWSLSGLQRGFMRGVGRGAGIRYDSPRQSFFDQREAEDRISDIEYDLKRGIGG